MRIRRKWTIAMQVWANGRRMKSYACRDPELTAACIMFKAGFALNSFVNSFVFCPNVFAMPLFFFTPRFRLFSFLSSFRFFARCAALRELAARGGRALLGSQLADAAAGGRGRVDLVIELKPCHVFGRLLPLLISSRRRSPCPRFWRTTNS